MILGIQRMIILVEGDVFHSPSTRKMIIRIYHKLDQPVSGGAKVGGTPLRAYNYAPPRHQLCKLLKMGTYNGVNLLHR